MSSFIFLSYDEEVKSFHASPETYKSLWKDASDFESKVVELGGSIVSGEAFGPAGESKHFTEGVLKDGPVFNTPKQLGGYYLVEAKDIDHALHIAQFFPRSLGDVEVRQLMNTTSQDGPASS